MYTVRLVGQLLVVSVNGMVGRMRKFSTREEALAKFFRIAEWLDDRGVLATDTCIES